MKVVLTKSALCFIDEQILPQNVTVYRHEKVWNIWKKLGDPLLQVELCNWVDMMISWSLLHCQQILLAR